LPSLRNAAKSLALSLINPRDDRASRTLARSLLHSMKIGFDPPDPRLRSGRYPSPCCISIDFDATKKERLRPNADGTVALINAAEKYKIPITWAVCGKTAEDDPESYRAIQNSSDRNEIAIHTYSHIDASVCTPQELSSDIRRCIQVLRLKDPPKSFVFPWNREGHLPLLQELGFTSFRGAKRRVGLPVLRSGLWDIPPVYYVGQAAFGSSSLLIGLLELCSSYGALFHVWTHPWDVVRPTIEEFFSSTVEPLFRRISDLRSSGELETLTMEKVALRSHVGTQAGLYGATQSPERAN
jgi:hypothetical protein